MMQHLFRFEYDDPPWSVIVTESRMVKATFEQVGIPDRIYYLGEWDIANAADYRKPEEAPK